MSLIPSFVSPKLPQWRGNTSSADLNENFSEIMYDLNTLFSEATNIVMELNDLESRIRHEVEALSERVFSVSGMITAYENSVPGCKIFFEDFFVPQNVTYPQGLTDESKCVVDNEFGVVTLPVNNSFSKVYTINITDGKTTVAPDLVVDVTPLDETENVKIEGPTPDKAFDGNDNTVWERKVRFNRDSTKNSVTALMTITLPSMNNPYVNKIHVKPYPEGTEDVQMISYDTTSTQDNILPSFPAAGENNIPRRMYSFNNIQPTKLKVYFRQRNGKMEDDYKTFVYGAKEIGIEKVEYRPSGKLGLTFDLPETEAGLLYQITSLRTDPIYDNIQYKVNLYSSQAEFDANLPIWTSSNSAITETNPLDIAVYGLSSLWIMVELTQLTGDTKTPILKSLTMTYTTVV